MRLILVANFCCALLFLDFWIPWKFSMAKNATKSNETATNNSTSIPSNGTAVASNGTSVPSNGTSVPSNGTSVPSNGTSVPSNETVEAPAGRATKTTVTLVHNGNMRAVFDEAKLPRGKEGSLSRLHAYLLNGRKAGKMFYFNVGNSYMETFFHKALNFHILTQVMEILKPDAMTLGLKAFAGAREELTYFMSKATYPLLSCNTNDSKLVPHKQFDLGGGFSLVVIGYISPLVNDFGAKIYATDPIQAIRNTVNSVKGAKKLIAVMGCSDIDMERGIARRVEGVDIIIGEAVLPTNRKDYPIEFYHKKGKTLILRTCAAAKNIGIFRLDLDSNGRIASYSAALTDMMNETSTSKDFTAMLEKFKPVMEKYDGEVVAKSRVNFNTECRRDECNLGNLITDAFIDYKASQYEGSYWTDTPIALINAGSIKEGVNIEIRNGELTRADILNVLPFHEFLVTMTLKGDEIYDIVEKGMKNFGTKDDEGSFLQVSGLRLICNKSLSAGKRVQYVKARCAECVVPSYKPVDPTGDYRIVTNEYLARGADDDLSLKEGRDVVYESITDVDAVMAYVQKYRIVMTEISDRLGTMVFLEGATCSPNHLTIATFCMVCFLINNS